MFRSVARRVPVARPAPGRVSQRTHGHLFTLLVCTIRCLSGLLYSTLGCCTDIRPLPLAYNQLHPRPWILIGNCTLLSQLPYHVELIIPPIPLLKRAKMTRVRSCWHRFSVEASASSLYGVRLVQFSLPVVVWRHDLEVPAPPRWSLFFSFAGVCVSSIVLKSKKSKCVSEGGCLGNNHKESEKDSANSKSTKPWMSCRLCQYDESWWTCIACHITSWLLSSKAYRNKSYSIHLAIILPSAHSVWHYYRIRLGGAAQMFDGTTSCYSLTIFCF